MVERPRIGVTGNGKRFSPAWWCTRLALWLAGAVPVRISVRHDPGDEPLQALVIGGGDDISPEHYGGDVNARVKIDEERDDLEIRWIKKALENNLPLLGICRGAQLINVVLGGSLHQDIRPMRKRTYNRPGLLPTKQVILEPESRVAIVCGKLHLRVNSLHHQAVKDTGNHLRAVGLDLDDIIEVIECTNPLLILVVQ
ncbi:MAG: gamma-glutamyl-gamma-aminobutyrate hydrolase family protein, partial [Gammaproteobacteria bacterium]|nr:gamma-glutamyl-gamma-aminobutyrate hydrolase family protein [Gammaproteobacteria bacterium]